LAENITSELFCVLTRFRSGNAELLVKCLGRNFPPNATYICYKVLADYVLKIRLIYMVQGVEVSCLVPRSTLSLHCASSRHLDPFGIFTLLLAIGLMQSTQ